MFAYLAGEKILIEANVVVGHGSPVPPLETYDGWRAVDLNHFPCECWHHPLERFVAGVEV